MRCRIQKPSERLGSLDDEYVLAQDEFDLEERKIISVTSQERTLRIHPSKGV